MIQMNACGWLMIQQQAHLIRAASRAVTLLRRGGSRAKHSWIGFCHLSQYAFVRLKINWEIVSQRWWICMWLVDLIGKMCFKPNQEKQKPNWTFFVGWNEFGGQQRNKWKFNIRLHISRHLKTSVYLRKPLWIFCVICLFVWLFWLLLYCFSLFISSLLMLLLSIQFRKNKRDSKCTSMLCEL